MSKLTNLISAIADMADESHGGHFTMMKFTTGWKIVLGTPAISVPDQDALSGMPPFMGLEGAAHYAIQNKPEWSKEQ